jgi:peptidoglycan/LPS O-acetylase OafA/YrhL
MYYRREIDGLRALAVLSVILFHSGFQTFSGGFVGVDIFFVISGYLITSIILAEIEAGTFTLANFYERRARRILPALFVLMALCLPFAWLWLPAQDMKSFSQSLVAVSTFASNILFWLTSGYFDTAAELKPLLHTWSLAVEEQYYLIFPLFVLLTWRFGKTWILKSLFAVFIISLAAAHWGSTNHPNFTFYLLPTRFWELLIGGFIAFYFSLGRKQLSHKWLNELGSFMGVALIAYSIFWFDSKTPFPSLYTLVPAVGAALIIFFTTPQTSTGKLLGSQLFVGVGLISYSAYLYHQPLLAFAKLRSIDEPSSLLIGLLFASTFLLAYLSWRFVEAPFRNMLGINRKQLFIFCILASFTFVLFGLVGHFTKGFESTKNSNFLYDGDIGSIDFHKYVADKYYKCPPKSIANEALNWKGYLRCHQSNKNSEVEIVLLGDSHAEHLFLGLADALPQKNISFYNNNSIPFLGNSEFEKIYKSIAQTKSIQVVFITMHWTGRLSQIPKNSSLEFELTNSINFLKLNGKKVYLLDDVPKFPFSPEGCKFGFGKCEISKSNITKYEKNYAYKLEEVASKTGVKLLKLRDFFCDDVKCSMLKNSNLLYADTHHLNILGSKYIGGEIYKLLPELAD